LREEDKRWEKRDAKKGDGGKREIGDKRKGMQTGE
jgi:hypothetical protein